MKINPIAATGTTKYREVSRKGEVAAKTIQGNDKLSLSNNAVSFSAALKAAKETPEIRETLVAGLKEKIDNGTYVVDSKAVAERMLNSFNFGKIL